MRGETNQKTDYVKCSGCGIMAYKNSPAEMRAFARHNCNGNAYSFPVKGTLIALAIAVLSGFLILWNQPKEIPCVPFEAIDYQGDHYWYDIHGNKVMYAPTEDAYERCKD